LIGIHALPAAAHARTNADSPAAIVTFPLVRVDSSRGQDTTIQLNNADTTPVDVACFLQHVIGHCDLNPQQPCAVATDCPAGDACSTMENVVTPFTLRLTASQPLRWRLSAGRASLPLPENLGSIPPAPSDPFVGTLRCIVVDASGRPVERNVLHGAATLEGYEAALERIDAATYNGIGMAALVGANNGDDALVVGGPAAEYEGCPSTLLVNHVADFALEPTARTSHLITMLSVASCGADLFGRSRLGGALAQIAVYNEFEQRFLTSRVFTTARPMQMSMIDTAQPTRSIFSASVLGTLAAQTRIQGSGSIMAIAIEEHHDLDDATRIATAALNTHSEGDPGSDTVFALGPCSGGPRPLCRDAQRNSLALSLGETDARDALVWTWRNGEATAIAEFGDPRTTSEYALCVYAGPAADVVTEIHVPPSAAAWQAVRRGFRYRDSAGTADGVRRMTLKRASAETAQVALNAKGPSLPAMAIGQPLTFPVVVQLRHTDSTVCFESTFTNADVVRNEPGRFEARTP
jgi:hypothetical protein